MPSGLARLALLFALVPACSLARAPILGATPIDGGRLDAPADATVTDAPRDAGAPLDAPGDAPVRDPLGAACGDASTCGSGFCVDGVCCESSCEGACESCTGAIDGRCVPAASGTDPEDECDDSADSTCGTSGECDGAGACALHASGTVCAPPSCTAGTQTLPRTCDGSGTCRAASTMVCVSGCDGTVCAGSCAMDSMCVAGTFCRVATGDCVPLLPLGAPAMLPAHCASGFLADGVCCESACGGTCEACLAAATGATDGACRPASTGTDPDGECLFAASSTCTTTGDCDGARACARWAAGTVCNAAACAGGTASAADLCDGVGTCTDSGTTACGAYACGAAACRTTCTIDAHCAFGNFCSLSGCVPLRPLGATCGGANECASGVCVDDVCCDTACTGTCNACTMSLRGGGAADGTCGPVLLGSDPASECATTAPATCGRTGSCDGAGACALWASGTECAPAACVGSTLEPPDLCNGAGTCVDSGAANCAPYACAASGLSCRTSCSGPADCAGGAACDTGTGVCGTSLPNGATCTSPAMCGSGICVDGVCCDGACTGLCFACTAALRGSGVDGQCGPVTADTDPSGECPTDAVSSCGRTGLCSGTGTCRLYPSGTVCASASCTGGSASPNDTCNGTGTCVDSGAVSCSPYLCGAAGLACSSSCASDADCSASNYCEISTSRCLPRSANGAVCSRPRQCTSNNCVDGYCCSSACGGTCMTCALPGMLGSCANVATGASDPGTCAAPMVCNGSGSCFRSNGQTCTGDSQCLSGHCIDGTCCSTTCTSNCRACDVAGSLGMCSFIPDGTDPDNDCVGGFVCNGSGGCR